MADNIAMQDPAGVVRLVPGEYSGAALDHGGQIVIEMLVPHGDARWIPLDTFEDIERKCRPEAVATLRPTWLIASWKLCRPVR